MRTLQPECILPRQSILGSTIYRWPSGVRRHVDRILSPPFDAILLYKLSEFLPELPEVYLNLEVVDVSLQRYAEACGLSDWPSPRLVRVFFDGWFFEISVALGALGGMNALVDLLQQLVTGPPSTDTTTNGESVAMLGDFDADQISEHYRKHLEFVEVYGGDGSIHRLLLSERDQGNR